MKGLLPLTLLLVSCAPVLRQELMEEASLDVPFAELTRNPDLYRGRLFVLGGIIVGTKLTDRGSLIEAVYVPVNSLGYLRGVELSGGRFLALYPKEYGLLDPVIYRRGREITVAGVLIGTEEGRIDEMQYSYPLFEIKELYLWEEREPYYIPPPYPYWYYPYPPYWWDPRWRHYYPPPPPYP